MPTNDEGEKYIQKFKKIGSSVISRDSREDARYSRTERSVIETTAREFARETRIECLRKRNKQAYVFAPSLSPMRKAKEDGRTAVFAERSNRRSEKHLLRTSGNAR